ncbi:Protein of unknown function (DUF3040) [Prauserella shujinwangii]|uniref:DUF3040 family protein n=1 Tax=Prauserella shujinwangii TaxID=1453103 RepID=A0A2T0LL79_9PSEU|nr:DUF3040 domain-containing protein [Prauserella shujinwangii]PRX43709.1 Protein of unknown function (DUF3040) [Prauserella shujinwangii]
MMSHHERQELERIEQWFHSDDPQLARSLGDGRPPRGRGHGGLLHYGLDALAAFLIVMGAITLNFGLIFVGALVLATAACLHVSSRSNARRSHPEFE